MKRNRRGRAPQGGIEGPSPDNAGMGERVEDRFYVESLGAGSVLELSDREAAHAAGSRRLRAGDAVTLFDGSGWDVVAKIVEASPKRIVLEEVSRAYVGAPLPVPVVCVSALPKGSHEDDLVALCAQLGITRLVPLESARSVVRPLQNQDKRRERLRRLAIEAAKQSETSTVMDIAEALSLSDVLRAPECLFAGTAASDAPSGGPGALRLIGVPRAERAVIDALQAAWPAAGVAYLIGPEGDFTDDERSAAVDAGFAPVCVSPTTLRVETAAAAFAAVISAFLCGKTSSGPAI